MTPELADALASVYDARVPKRWVFTVGGDELSWLAPTLGLWFAGLVQRDAQLRSWLNESRPVAFWMTGFFNPQGFLTAMRQEVTRMHVKDRWALDDVVFHTEVLEYDKVEQVRSPPREGVFIHGLFLDGAAYSRAEASLVESEVRVVWVGRGLGLIRNHEVLTRTCGFFLLFCVCVCVSRDDSRSVCLRRCRCCM